MYIIMTYLFFFLFLKRTYFLKINVYNLKDEVFCWRKKKNLKDEILGPRLLGSTLIFILGRNLQMGLASTFWIKISAFSDTKDVKHFGPCLDKKKFWGLVHFTHGRMLKLNVFFLLVSNVCSYQTKKQQWYLMCVHF